VRSTTGDPLGVVRARLGARVGQAERACGDSTPGYYKRRTSNVPWPAFCRHPASTHSSVRLSIAISLLLRSHGAVWCRAWSDHGRFTDGPPAASPGCSDEVGERTQGGRTCAEHRLQPTIQAEVALCLLVCGYQHATSQPGSRHAGRNAHWLAPSDEAMSESCPISSRSL
jgi:hypothetical protein